MIVSIRICDFIYIKCVVLLSIVCSGLCRHWHRSWRSFHSLRCVQWWFAIFERKLHLLHAASRRQLQPRQMHSGSIKAVVPKWQLWHVMRLTRIE